MASRRAHLRDLIHRFRRYLVWHRKQGVDAYVPADDADRAEFEARKKAIQEQQLAELRGEVDDGPEPSDAPDRTPPSKPADTTPAFADESEQPEPSEETDSPTTNGVSADTPLWKQHDPIHEMTASRSADGDDTTSDASEPSSGSTDNSSGSANGTPETPAEKMAFLRDYLGDCQRCPLCENRTNVVFGDGDPTTRLMFVGEGPGREEDRQGLPFVGPSGQLLTKMIEGMGLSRDEVYITNVVKCRPPQNRNPAPLEIKECAPFLKKQIEVIEPETIVTVGKFASNTLLDKDKALRDLRGRWHEHMGIPVMPTYHPAYLLRNEGDRELKRRTWDDLKMVMKRLGLNKP